MPTSNPIYGDDTVVQVNDGASSAFADIDDILDATGPGPERAHVERKRLNNAGIVERTPGNRIDYGEVSLTLEMKGPLFTRFKALQQPTATFVPGAADTRVFSWKFKYPDGHAQAFGGSVRSVKPNAVSAGEINSFTVVVVVQTPVADSYTAAAFPINPDVTP